MQQRRDEIRLWRDSRLPGGLEMLRARCFDYRYPAHAHDEFVIAAFVRGAQRHRIARYAGVAAAGTVMIIPPGEVHTGEAVESDLGWDYCAFYPTGELLAAIADDVIGGTGCVDFGRDLLRPDLRLARRLFQAQSLAMAAHDPLAAQSAIYEAFGELIRRYGERASASPKGAKRPANINRAIEFIEERYDRILSVHQVATVAGVSDYHLMRTFRVATGLSVHTYLTQVRLTRAKSLLLSGVGAAEVSIDVGFCDQSHLINQFRRHLGVTARAYVAASR